MSYENLLTGFSYDIFILIGYNWTACRHECCMKTAEIIFIQHKLAKMQKMSYETAFSGIYTTFVGSGGNNRLPLSVNAVYIHRNPIFIQHSIQNSFGILEGRFLRSSSLHPQTQPLFPPKAQVKSEPPHLPWQAPPPRF